MMNFHIFLFSAQAKLPAGSANIFEDCVIENCVRPSLNCNSSYRLANQNGKTQGNSIKNSKIKIEITGTLLTNHVK